MAKLKTPILLVIQREGEEQRIEEFHENIIKIGKLSSVNLRLEDPNINRIHAVIEVTGDEEAQVIDMGSSKGTRVNGKRIHKTKITTGDQLLLGSTEITVYIGDTAVTKARQGDFGDPSSEEPPSEPTAITMNPRLQGSPASISQKSPSSTLGFDGSLTADAVMDAARAITSGKVDVSNQVVPPTSQGNFGESTQITKNPLVEASQIIGSGTHIQGTDQFQQITGSDDDGEHTASVSPDAAAAVAAAAAAQQAEAEAAAQAAAAAQQAAYEQQQAQAAQQAAYAAQQQQAYEQQQAAAYAAQQQAAQQAAYEQQQAQAQAAAAAQQQAAAQQAAYEQQQAQAQQAAYEQQQAQAAAAQQATYAAQSAAYPAANVGYNNPMAPQMTGAAPGMNPQMSGGFQQHPSQAPAPQQAAGFGAPGPVRQAQTAPIQPMGMSMGMEYTEADTHEALEVRVLWGDTILDHAHFYNPKRITIGESRKNTFSISSESLPPELDSFPLIEAEDDRLQINFTDVMTGSVQIKDQMFSLEQIKQSAKVQRTEMGYQFALPAQSQVQLRISDLTFIISFVPAPKRIPPAVLYQVDHHLARSMGLSFLLHGIVFLFMLFADESPQGLDDGLFGQNNRFANLIIRPEEPKPPKREKPPPTRTKSKKKRGKKGKSGAKAKGKEGKMGRKNKPTVRNRRSGQKKRNPDGKAPIDMEKVAKKLRDRLGKKGMLNILASGRAGRAYGSILTAKGRGGDDKNAIGGWRGSKVGTSGGSGGLGRGGKGYGGGGLSGKSVGLGGRLGTYGRGGGRGGRGYGRGRFRKKRKQTIKVSAGRPVVFGSLDKEIIRRIINQHRSQIKYCYERELIKHPKLQGKVKVFFQIEGTGRVSTSRVSQSTMNNDRVEQCIVRRARYWRFPAPKGGGIVHVNYPFYFKPS